MGCMWAMRDRIELRMILQQASTSVRTHRLCSQLPWDITHPREGQHQPQNPWALQPATPGLTLLTSRWHQPQDPPGHAGSYSRTQTHPPGASSLHARQGLPANWTRGQSHIPARPQYSWFQNKRRTHSAHIGISVDHKALVTRVCFWDTQDIAYIRPFLQDKEV